MSALAGPRRRGGVPDQGARSRSFCPAVILFLWSLATRTPRDARASARSRAGAARLPRRSRLPGFSLVEQRHPGFLDFFFVREQLQRFATKAAKRTGARLLLRSRLLLGFLPGTAVLRAAESRRSWRRDSDGFFFLLWFAVVFVFFSLSQSKLPPYLFPAIPAAAVLAAPGASRRTDREDVVDRPGAAGRRRSPRPSCSCPSSARRRAGSRSTASSHPLLAILVLASWAAVLFAGTLRPALALRPRARLGRVLRSPSPSAGRRCRQARFPAELADGRAPRPRLPRRAVIVGYKDYLNGFSWELKSPIPVAAYRGELEPEFETRPEVREALFWSGRAVLGGLEEPAGPSWPSCG